MVVLAFTAGARIGIIVAAGLVLWIALAAAAAGYGRGKGYPFWPLFISAFFLGPPGWALVLLAVTIGAGARRWPGYAEPSGMLRARQPPASPPTTPGSEADRMLGDLQ